MGEKTWRRINYIMILLIVAVNGYTVLGPVMPQLSFWARKGSRADASAYVETRWDTYRQQVISLNDGTTPPADRIIVPKMGMDQPLVVGSSPSLLHQGIWHRPNTSTPDKGSNTVLVAHRYNYTGKPTFYHLDKLARGDQITLFWKGEQFRYIVREQRIVDPSEVTIEARTDNSQLTLYTCTPLWTSAQRLVVIADLEQKESGQ